MVWILGWVFPAVKMPLHIRICPSMPGCTWFIVVNQIWNFRVQFGYMQTNELEQCDIARAASQQMLPSAALHSAPGLQLSATCRA